MGLLRNDLDGLFHNLGGVDNHALLQAPGILLFSIHHEGLAFGNLELLIRSVIQGQNHESGGFTCHTLPVTVLVVVTTWVVVLVVIVR